MYSELSDCIYNSANIELSQSLCHQDHFFDTGESIEQLDVYQLLQSLEVDSFIPDLLPCDEQLLTSTSDDCNIGGVVQSNTQTEVTLCSLLQCIDDDNGVSDVTAYNQSMHSYPLLPDTSSLQTSLSKLPVPPLPTIPPPSTRPPRRGVRLNKVAVALMQQWYAANTHYPYPDYTTTEHLALAGGIKPEQVKKWCSNRRMRDSRKSRNQNQNSKNTLSMQSPLLYTCTSSVYNESDSNTGNDLVLLNTDRASD